MVELAAAPVLGVETVSAFDALRGDLQPGDAGYDEAHAGMEWDDRQAAWTDCECAGGRTSSKLSTWLASTGSSWGDHSVAGHCVCDGGIMIDLSRSCARGSAHRKARARKAGRALGNFDQETQALGLGHNWRREFGHRHR